MFDYLKTLRFFGKYNGGTLKQMPGKRKQVLFVFEILHARAKTVSFHLIIHFCGLYKMPPMASPCTGFCSSKAINYL